MFSRVSLVCGLLLTLLPSPEAFAEQPPAAATHESWAMQAGDDPRWSRPDFDDSAWPRVSVQSTWRQLGHQHRDGIVWFRSVVRLGDEARLASQRNELALLLGPPASGGYEAFAGGRWIGRSRGWSTALAFGLPEVFRVPRESIGRDGTVQLALRVRRIGWASDADPEGGPVSGVLVLGMHDSLLNHTRVFWMNRLMGELPLLVLAALFAFVSLHHILLFARRRRQIEHLWFGLLSLAFAVNTFASTYWIYELTASRGIATRTSDLTGHLASALMIQFLWTFFSRRISRALRAYQISHLALALFVGLWPDLHAVFASATARWLWLLPLLIVAAALVLQEARRGNSEARIIAAGGVIMTIVEAFELTRNVLSLDWPFDFSLAAFGFATVIVAMSLALSYRFRRVHDELDRLRFRLEDEVRKRTHDLEEARDDALSAYRAKGEFLANISHEIRTPMNGVIGMAELLACTPLNEEQRRHLEVIQTSGRSLLTLLNDILDYSRLDAKKLTVAHEPFNLRNVVEECVGIMTPMAQGKALSLDLSFGSDTVESLCGDQNRTRQVLLNLLSNAIKFTTHGGVNVEVSSRDLGEGRSEVRFAVTDTGLGIAREDLARLFVPFQQVDGSASRPYSGAGLGLAISKRLTELMGGSIEVWTAPGLGSTFSFSIAGERVSLASVPAEASRPVPPVGDSRLRILVAEDEEINRIVILGMLQQLGHHADSVSSGSEVLQSMERNSYDAILMDVQMPGMDGLETTRRLRGMLGSQPNIIALTAHALADDRERCLGAGMNDYLTKPVSLAALQSVLAGVVRPE